MSLAAVRAALETALNAISPALDTVWENTLYVPTDGTPYQKVNLLPAEPENPTMGDGYYREIGVLQVSLFYPQSKGAKAAQDRAALVQSAFKRGAMFTSGGVTTRILRTPAIGPGMADGNFWMLPVSIRYSSEFFS